MLRSPALNFACGAALAAFALAALSPGLLNDGDTYWHIRAGEWMLAHRAVLRADVFSATAAGAPWHTQEWLAEILMALGWRGGWAGIHLLFAAAAALTTGMTAWFVRRRVDFVPALVAVVLGLSCVTGSLLARPHMLALPLLAIWTAGLAGARENHQAPRLWLIAVMPLWANLHGSFAFGLALAAALGIEAVIEDRKAALGWAIFLLGATLSSLATPFGFSGLLFPFKLSAMQGLGHIGEWQASDFRQVSPFAIALLTTLFVMGRGRLKVPALRLLILLGLVWLALRHGRHQMLLGVAAPILLATSLAKTWPAKSEDGKPLLFLLAAGFAALIPLRLALPVVRSDDPVSPVAALAHVPRLVRETPVLNDYSFGGYLIWNGVKPFIDSRADLYGDSFLQNYAAVTAPDKDALAATLALYHVHWTIFAKDAPVVKLLDARPGWHRFYADKLAVVHVHD
ncbi:MAG: hypothetical protein JF627_03250 [Alphaproteobacteria bacterium]|nr:hypothetical protein [Alphaproteobacteria bacterium]